MRIEKKRLVGLVSIDIYNMPSIDAKGLKLRIRDRQRGAGALRLSHVMEAPNRSQLVTGSQKHRDPRFPPYAFTEHGAMMAAMILNSPRAVETSVYVVRAFVKLRKLLASNRELARRFEQLEARVEKLVAHDQALGVILSAIRKLMPPPPEPPNNRPIGFTADLEDMP